MTDSNILDVVQDILQGLIVRRQGTGPAQINEFTEGIEPL